MSCDDERDRDPGDDVKHGHLVRADEALGRNELIDEPAGETRPDQSDDDRKQDAKDDLHLTSQNQISLDLL